MSDIEEKKQISYGKLISKDAYKSTSLIPKEVKSNLKVEDYYLLIYIPGEDIIKLSIFPCKNKGIKKILIRLKEFSPDLVKGISDVLKNFNLGSETIHTTGLCFSGINCFYETYIDSTNLDSGKIAIDSVKEEFLKVPRVVTVEIVDLDVSGL
jgi:hypothetical protein